MRKRCLLQTSAALCLALLPPALAQETPPSCSETVAAPYVFFLFDTSGSMSWSPPCTQTQIGNGECSFLCPTGDCFVPLQADDPASKFHQVKQALFNVLANNDWQHHFGLATFNQDDLNVRAKHWVYQADGPGVAIPGWGALPAQGSREVFGYAWSCDTGSGDHEIGCYSSKPADLSDAWELTRIQRLPKGGASFSQIVNVFVRHASAAIYRVRYTPKPGFQLGGPLATDIRVDRCLNSSCSSITSIGTATVSWTPVSEFLSWDNAAGNPYRTNPQQSYFAQGQAADILAGNTCAGWDPNTDTANDLYNGYNLRWPTVSDPRGPLLSSGDVLPWDWQRDYRDDILVRLAPNLAFNPAAMPDFRQAPYFENFRIFAEDYLRLRFPQQRPLIASGSTPHGNALRSFLTWYAGCPEGPCGTATGWRDLAEAQDPEWLCRRKAVVILTDGDETCPADPCAAASELLLSKGIYTFVIAYGVDSLAPNQLNCIATNGGTNAVFYPRTPEELYNALNDVLSAVPSLSDVIVHP